MHAHKSDLRKRAEENADPSLQFVDSQTSEQIRETLHELRVYQIELEMQNEELRAAQAKLEAERVHYFAFYNLSPVGFLTLSEQGLILEANIIAAGMLGVGWLELNKQPITRFIYQEDQDAFYLLHKQEPQPAKESGPDLAREEHDGHVRRLELRLVRKDGVPFWVCMESLTVRDPSVFPERGDDNTMIRRVVVTDITERKHTEAALYKAFKDIKTLRGILPICAACKKIRDDAGYWHQVEEYVHAHTEADFSHGICPECIASLYPEYLAKTDERSAKEGGPQ
jgi:PAS domain S-box-containing protein